MPVDVGVLVAEGGAATPQKRYDPLDDWLTTDTVVRPPTPQQRSGLESMYVPPNAEQHPPVAGDIPMNQFLDMLMKGDFEHLTSAQLPTSPEPPPLQNPMQPIPNPEPHPPAGLTADIQTDELLDMLMKGEFKPPNSVQLPSSPGPPSPQNLEPLGLSENHFLLNPPGFSVEPDTLSSTGVGWPPQGPAQDLVTHPPPSPSTESSSSLESSSSPESHSSPESSPSSESSLSREQSPSTEYSPSAKSSPSIERFSDEIWDKLVKGKIKL